MNVKRIKRICGVRGCKNTESFALSRYREMGNSVIICKECLKKALDSIDNYEEPEKVKTEQKPLFYHPEIDVTPSSVAEIEPEPQEVIEEVTEDISISVAEDSVTNEEHTPPSSSSSPTSAPLPSRAKTTNSGAKKKPNKKK